MASDAKHDFPERKLVHDEEEKMKSDNSLVGIEQRREKTAEEARQTLILYSKPSSPQTARQQQ